MLVYLRVHWASGCLLYRTRLGYRGERFQESCGLGNRRDVMSHLHETCSTCWVQLMLPRVVIVGGGFGGLAAARALRNTPVSVTLIDKRNYHLFRPMLYQVATGLLSADEISGPLRSIFSHQKNVDVLLDEVTGINPDQRIV
jgi:NADPH-dependent 2,4-dienoyl-CoA reductase/sulfur reductase-like enzyme